MPYPVKLTIFEGEFNLNIRKMSDKAKYPRDFSQIGIYLARENENGGYQFDISMIYEGDDVEHNYASAIVRELTQSSRDYLQLFVHTHNKEEICGAYTISNDVHEIPKEDVSKIITDVLTSFYDVMYVSDKTKHEIFEKLQAYMLDKAGLTLTGEMKKDLLPAVSESTKDSVVSMFYKK